MFPNEMSVEGIRNYENEKVPFYLRQNDYFMVSQVAENRSFNDGSQFPRKAEVGFHLYVLAINPS